MGLLTLGRAEIIGFYRKVTAWRDFHSDPFLRSSVAGRFVNGGARGHPRSFTSCAAESKNVFVRLLCTSLTDLCRESSFRSYDNVELEGVKKI